VRNGGRIRGCLGLENPQDDRPFQGPLHGLPHDGLTGFVDGFDEVEALLLYEVEIHGEVRIK
jgi:hypothetical protein